MMANRTHRAFTLVELLLGMTLTVLVGGVIFLLQSTGMSTVRKGTSQLMLTSEIRNKMERVVADLRSAKEILEVRPDSIKIRTYKFIPGAGTTGDDALVTVTYEVERGGRQDILWRTVNRDNPVKMLSLDRIGAEVFFPYFETPDKASPTGWKYELYNMNINDTGQRERISFFRIQLSFKNANETAVLTTSAHLRPASSRIRQPNWKFR